jgi:hypothetical protein
VSFLLLTLVSEVESHIYKSMAGIGREFGKGKCCLDFIAIREFLVHIADNHVGQHFAIPNNSESDDGFDSYEFDGELFKVLKICDVVPDSLCFNPGCDCPDCVSFQFNQLQKKFETTQEELESLKLRLKGKTFTSFSKVKWSRT